MQITIVTIGSRGDVQPFVALGRGLRARGHIVTVNTHRHFETFIRANDLHFAPLAGDPEVFLQMLTKARFGANLIQFSRMLWQWSSQFADEAMQDMWRACQDADLILYGFLGIAVHHVAEKLGIPTAAIFLMPVFEATGEYPGVNAPCLLPKTPTWNRLSHHIERQMAFWMFRPMFGKFRHDFLQLPPMPMLSYPYDTVLGRRVHKLYCYSPSVIPRPQDWDESPHLHVSGYLFLDDDNGWQPSSALLDFLDAGPPPVYIGFGSLMTDQPEALLELTLKALAHSGQRGLLLTGWGGFSNADLPDTVFKIDAAPHHWLLPRMAAVVHHGGAGTTAAGLRAGIPSIVIPFFGDQPFWGRRVYEIGVGPQPIPARYLNTQALAQAITSAIEDTTIRQQAADLGRRIQAEDGVRNATDIIEAIGEYN